MPRLLRRREFLRSAGCITSALAMTMPMASARSEAASPSRRNGCIDVNVHLFRWPLRRLPLDETDRLAAHLRKHGITEAWAGSLEVLLHKDLGSANARLAAECRRHGRGLFRPFGTINPQWPDWEEELRRCIEVHRMPGIRLFPNYHEYPLTDPKLRQLLELARQSGLIVQIAGTMEDERMMHPHWRVPPVDFAPLPELLKDLAGLKLVLLNALKNPRADWLRAVELSAIGLDLAMLEGIGAVGRFLESFPKARLMFGSHAPLFYIESSVLKLKESPLTAAQQQSLQFENARLLLS
ncbi:MAG: amidohydrolase family protein [Verrucomicrobiota bacterium]